MKLLMIEDEPVLSQAAIPVLEKSGLLVDVVESLRDAFSAIAVFSYDLILLDRNLPDGDGISFLESLRRKSVNTPVIIMSAAKRTVDDRIEGLNIGADDYLIKPIDFSELVARIRSMLRRPRELEKSELIMGNLSFGVNSRSVAIDGKPIKIARRELGMLEQLMRAKGRVVSREHIEQNSYGFDDIVTINAIDVSMHRLRTVLKRNKSSIAIRTVRGVGYLLQERSDSQ